tara:strand:+ start:114 stop:260 length:147 start_codon:yes stop_codon:yes gene_type:complete
MLNYIIYFIELILDFCSGKNEGLYDTIESKNIYHLEDPEDYHYHPFEF